MKGKITKCQLDRITSLYNKEWIKYVVLLVNLVFSKIQVLPSSLIINKYLLISLLLFIRLGTMEISLIPTFLLNKIQIDDQSKIHLNVFITNLVLLLVLFSMNVNIVLINSLPHFCLSQSVLDFPCLGCGITNGIISLSNFNLQNAIDSNPASILLFAFFIIQLPLRLLALLHKSFSNTIFIASKNISYFVLTGLLVSWVLNFN